MKIFFVRSLWRKETELSAEIEKLRTEVEKAEKSLDHATPGVSNCFLYFCSFCYAKHGCHLCET